MNEQLKDSTAAFWLANRVKILAAIEAAGLELLSNKDGFWLNSFAAPKTSFDHWVDEVEASGEPEKHADSPFGWWHQGATDEESDFFKAGDFGNVACPECIALYARPADSEAAKYKALYEKSQELFARERGITKELTVALRDFVDAHAAPSHFCKERPEYERAVAALSKVQHVAARGAEVSE